MIPMGNWADRIEELESENHDLREEVSKMDSEIQDYLYEIDRLHDRNNELVDQIEQVDNAREAVGGEWAELYEALLERAERAEREWDNWQAFAIQQEERADNAEARAVQAGEARDYWQNVANHVKDERDHLQEVNESLGEDLTYWIDASEADEETFWNQEARIEDVQLRANAWFEQAKNLVRARDIWVSYAVDTERALKLANTELDELKAALRTLGRE